jgi:DNA-binding IclR family transcriptional regulator
VARDEVGRFLLGPAFGRLARAAEVHTSRTLVAAARPALAELRDRTGESAQLYVRAGDSRLCVLSLESPYSLRTIVAVGATLPMDRGSAAKILAADPEVLRRGWAQSVEEREKGVASVSAPVILDGQVVAAVSVSGPIERTTRQPGHRYATAVTAAARAVGAAIA